jgi:hypothetical protein
MSTKKPPICLKTLMTRIGINIQVVTNTFYRYTNLVNNIYYFLNGGNLPNIEENFSTWNNPPSGIPLQAAMHGLLAGEAHTTMAPSCFTPHPKIRPSGPDLRNRSRLWTMDKNLKTLQAN